MTSMRHSDTDSQIVKDVKSAIADHFEERYSDPRLKQFLNESAALDPRFKSLPHLDDFSRTRGGGPADAITERVGQRAVQYLRRPLIRSNRQLVCEEDSGLWSMLTAVQRSPEQEKEKGQIDKREKKHLKRHPPQSQSE
ncbi:hypothetical protein SKAU_G00163410 [Synaphobranchus kaupii]|uniref:Uncharacterized protein n=1 Tax=Synaphobranchus kaupii TaxID=118154 RepID=A0A9Q1FJ33_SYNKA|nr:hypothetical protein SKAU_G00163410 [Synaphobranchus kaupii]